MPSFVGISALNTETPTKALWQVKFMADLFNYGQP